MKYFLGADNGGTMTKAVLFDETGREIASAANKTPLIVPEEGYNERDMAELWEITAKTIKSCIEGAAIDARDILAVGCSGHGKGLYLWGKDGQPAYHAIASTDHRAYDIIRRWMADGTNERAKEKVLQNVIECQPVALLRWLKENDPEVLAKTEWIFEAKDYIRFMLTGEAYAEITDYSGTCLMNLKTSQFERELLEIYGIGEVYEKLPPIRYSCDVCGHVTEKASRETGIPEGTAVCGGMFDIDACAIAMGAHQDDDICVITGTWAINEYVSSEYHKGNVRNSLFCVPGSYLIEESSPASAGNMEWIIANFMEKDLEECKRNGVSVYDKINAMVDGLPPEKSGAVFLPFLYGTNVDGLDRACFFGLVNSYDKSHVLRAVYEGVAFCHMNHIDRLLEGRRRPAYLKLAGGVAKSPVWSQMFADISGIPVKTIEGNELGGLGCAIAGSVAVGTCRDLDEAVGKMVRVSRVFQPDPDKVRIYKKKYELYNEIIGKLTAEGGKQ
jgi:L-xylulokinase